MLSASRRFILKLKFCLLAIFLSPVPSMHLNVRQYCASHSELNLFD